MSDLERKKAQAAGVRQAIGRLQESINGLPEDAGEATLQAFNEGIAAQREKLQALEAEVGELEPGSTKNAEGRSFPFGSMPDLAEVLRRQRERTKEIERETGEIIRHVFHRGGRPVGDFKKAWASACVRAGLGQWRDPENRRGYVGLIFHDLRRTAVRNLVRAGVPEKTAMVLTGHKTRSVFDRYDIVDEDDLRAGVERLAEFQQGAKAERKALPMRRRAEGG